MGPYRDRRLYFADDLSKLRLGMEL
jgi:hypothetical protein